MLENTIVYLRNGQKAKLHKELADGTFVIEKIYSYIDYRDYENFNEIEESNGIMEVVNELFKSPPKEKIDETILKLNNEILEKKRELSELSKQHLNLQQVVNQLHQKTTNLDNFIINKSELKEAKSISFFVLEKYDPIILKDIDFRNFRLSFEYKINEDYEKSWYYKLTEDNWGTSYCIDSKYGLMFNITTKELIDISKKRSDDVQIKYHKLSALLQSDEKYLSKALIAEKKKLLKEDYISRIKDQEREVKKEQDHLTKLKKQFKGIK